MASEMGEARRLAVEGKLEIGGGAAADAGFALAVIWVGEKEEEAREEGQDEACFEIPF